VPTSETIRCKASSGQYKCITCTKPPGGATLTETQATLEELRQGLHRVATTGASRVAGLATWLADRPQEIAFNSVRGLAERSGANANTVVRLAHAMGYAGYEPLRNAFQDALRQSPETYGSRAGQLQQQDSGAVLEQIRAAGHQNLEALFSPENQRAIEQAAQLMLAARRIHIIGVRSCYAVADYLGYTARMAFDNVAPRAATPGDIRDRIADAGPKDVVLSITFPHYSVETVLAHELALDRGARTVAITDSLRSPIARGADVVLRVEMQGPQPLPSMAANFALAEALVASMVVRSEDAQRNIARFEQRLLESGAYHRP
jgi:DNA-binding MurR/RpiR family transcriptional regulator